MALSSWAGVRLCSKALAGMALVPLPSLASRRKVDSSAADGIGGKVNSLAPDGSILAMASERSLIDLAVLAGISSP